MGLLSKLGIIEENPNYDKVDEVYTPVEEENAMDVVDVEVENVCLDTLVNDIYQQNNLYEKSKSIFKAEEVINSLPKEMVTETKRNTVISILASFGLTATDIVEDGEQRLAVLVSASEKIEKEAREVITDNQNKIEAFKRQIADLEKVISSKNEEIDQSKDAINMEVKRLSGLIRFMDRGEEK